MRAFRLIGYALTLLALGLIAAVIFVIRNQDRLARLALDRIRDRTGLDIQITGTRLGLGSHLVIVLEHPRVMRDGIEAAHMTDIRAVLSYGAILRQRGLPLRRLVLNDPVITLSNAHFASAVIGPPKFNAEAVSSFNRALDALSDTILQLDVSDAAVADQDHPIVEHFSLRAWRHHLELHDRLWHLDFDATLKHASLDGTRLSGRLSLGASSSHTDQLATGKIWFWNLTLHNFELGKLSTSADLAGELSASLADTGTVSGVAAINAAGVALSGPAMSDRVVLGDYRIASPFAATPDRLDLSKINVTHQLANLLTGSVSLKRPFEADRLASIKAEGAKIELKRLASELRPFRAIPAPLLQFASQLDSGHLIIEQIAITSDRPMREWSAAELRDGLQFQAQIRDAGYRFAPETKLPPIRRLAAQLYFADGKLRISQASLNLGASNIESLDSEAELMRFPNQLPYKLRTAGTIDVTEFGPLLIDNVAKSAPAVASHLAALKGRAPIAIEASGAISNARFSMPSDYRAQAELKQLSIAVKEQPQPIAFSGGRVIVTPLAVQIDHVRAIPPGSDGGSATLNGSIDSSSGVRRLRDLTLELHQVEVGTWLPMFIEPDALAADGPVGGTLRADSNSTRLLPSVTGKLTMTNGHLSLGFMRSPIAAHGATLAFDGRGLVLDMPGSKLEQQPLDFRMAVADLEHPTVRIDATAGRLDFEALRFIRLPWSPATPPHFFAAPVSGHIEARQANFDRLPLAAVATDFSRDSINWRVDNFRARVFKGDVALSISGRARDDWIEMKGKIAAMDASQLFSMLADNQRPTLSGNLDAEGDLWANTDVNFFQTLAGTLSMKTRDGRLDRFTLLSRILGLIDLKNWLTAQVPDPRIAGLPFKTLSGDFKGARGDFYTDNLRLDGPVMDITARGEMRFSDSQINMEVGVLPLQSVNWIMHHIPLIGKNLAAGTHGIVAGYFQVSGPFRDPTVRPKPITSIAEFAKKMLGLPINIIAPNTIR